jgi:peptide/nickel transport system permease protein
MIAQALARCAFQLWLVSVLAFGLLVATPGDPARMILSASGLDLPTQPEVDAKRRELGLDLPLAQRYAHWLAGAVRGDFGRSYRTARPVTAMYWERLPATLALALLALALTLAIALPVGVVAAYHGRVGEAVLQGVVLFGGAVPGFWLSLLLILLFAATLRWLPALGSPTPHGMVMPAVALALPHVAVLARLARAAMRDAIATDAFRTARAKGNSRARAALRHALPHVFVSVLAVLGLEAAYLITGAAVLESVFAYPGVGRLAVDAALVGDLPVLAFCVLMASVVYGVCSLLADIAATRIDPRLRRADVP